MGYIRSLPARIQTAVPPKVVPEKPYGGHSSNHFDGRVSEFAGRSDDDRARHRTPTSKTTPQSQHCLQRTKEIFTKRAQYSDNRVADAPGGSYRRISAIAAKSDSCGDFLTYEPASTARFRHSPRLREGRCHDGGLPRSRSASRPSASGRSTVTLPTTPSCFYEGTTTQWWRSGR